MSNKPKKNNNLWVLIVLLAIFAPGILSGAAKLALGIISPFLIIAAVVVALVLLSRKKPPSKDTSAAKAAGQQQSRMNAESSARAEKEEKRSKLKKSAKPAVLKVLAILFYIFAGLMGFTAVMTLAETGATSDFAGLLAMTLYFFASGGISHIASNVFRRRERDAFRYAMLIGEKETYSLAKLAATTSYSISKVRRDLQRMIDNGVFGEQAYIDMASCRFMRHAGAVPETGTQQGDEYSRTMSGVATDIAKNAPSVQTEAPQAEAVEGETDISDFGAVLAKIRRLDEEIRDEAVSERIRKIEAITRNIFDYVKDKPEKMTQIRMFMNYYLPTTLKLLESYSRIERVGVAGQNMRDAKVNIEKILDMLVVGFEQQFDQLFKAESLDITSDIEVLEQMMKKDGLRENDDFVIREEEAAQILEEFTDGFSDEISDDLSDEQGGAAVQQKPE